MLTKYSHLQDGEIVAATLNSSASSELEMELARRLSDLIDERDELFDKLAAWNPYIRPRKPEVKYVGDA